MNPFALAAKVCLGVLAASLLLALAAAALDSVLHRRERVLFAACCFAAGFCTAVAAFALRT